MAREKKDGRFINYYIKREVYDELKKYAEEKGQTITMALERILEEYLRESDKKVNKKIHRDY